MKEIRTTRMEGDVINAMRRLHQTWPRTVCMRPYLRCRNERAGVRVKVCWLDPCAGHGLPQQTVATVEAKMMVCSFAHACAMLQFVCNESGE